jgi:hypothetical protein
VLSLWQKLLLLLLLLLRGALCRARCISDLRKKASSPVSPDDDQSQLAPGTASPKVRLVAGVFNLWQQLLVWVL